MSATDPQSTAVIIVGGSLVGLSTALCLAAHNVPSVILERHAGSSSHPRALGFTSRTMEIYRSLGFQSRIKEADPDFKLLRARVHSLAGEWYERFPWTENQKPSDPREYTISAGAAIPQDELEHILRSEASKKSEIQLRYSNTLESLEQDDAGVRATVRDKDGHQYTLHASYLVAADGNRSRIRQQLGIEREGEAEGKGKMGTISSVMFRASLEEYLKDGVVQFNIDQDDLKAFMTHYLDGRWALMFTDAKDRTPEEQEAAIYRAIGRQDLNIEILTTGRWELSMLIADRFRKGRVFLAGDAAHTLPPNRGGFGANTGIADAWNIAWKLAAVLSGAATDALLDTYEAERRPIALLRKEQISARADYKAHIKEKSAPAKVIDEVAMEVGELYRSMAEPEIAASLPAAQRPEEWKGQPGTRAAHLWLKKGNETISSLDLYGHDWVLISEDPSWKESVDAVTKNCGIDIKPVCVGTDVQIDDLSTFQSFMGLSNGGASLIRPDGIIAWRYNGEKTERTESLQHAVEKEAFCKKNNA